MRKYPSQEELKHFFNYDPETGYLTWRVDRAYKIKAGERAGTLDEKGYRRVVLRDKQYLEHIIIWIWMTGERPTMNVDHEDRVRDHNKWKNLRLATLSQNQANLKEKKSKLGVRGVERAASVRVKPDGSGYDIVEKFSAKIMVRGFRSHLGTFDTPEEAHDAYKTAHLKAHGEFSVFFKKEDDDS